MKDTTMPSTTWKADLTTVTNPNTVGDVRQWLKQNGHRVPNRDADAVGKYLDLALTAFNRRNGVLMPAFLKRPQPVHPPLQQGSENGQDRTGNWFLQRESWASQLAKGAFGLLVMLALVSAFRG